MEMRVWQKLEMEKDNITEKKPVIEVEKDEI